MKYLNLLTCLLVLGCSDIMDPEVDTTLETNKAASTDAVVVAPAPENMSNIDKATQAYISEYHRKPMAKNVNHYAKWIAQDLFANLDYPSNQDVFVISDFALLDSDLNETNHFGRQLTEALMHEVSRTGFSVIDTKATGFIRITEKGDVFFHSKDYTELSQKVPATNIIAGTLTKHQGGYLVNARVISMETMAMISSAQAFVPYDVVDAVLMEEPVITVADATQQVTQAQKEKQDETSPKTVGIPLKAYNKSINQ